MIARMMFNVMFDSGKALHLNWLRCGVWFSVCDRVELGTIADARTGLFEYGGGGLPRGRAATPLKVQWI